MYKRKSGDSIWTIFGGGVLGIVAVIALLGILFGIVFSLWFVLIWTVCWAFGITFSIKYVFGVMAINIILSLLFKNK